MSLAEARTRLAYFEQEESTAFSDQQAAIESIIHQTSYLGQPLSPSMLERLRSAIRFLADFVVRNESQAAAQPAVAKAHYLLGRGYLLQGHVGRARTALEESNAVMVSLLADSVEPELELGIAMATNSMCCAMVGQGEFEVAAGLLEGTSDRLEKLVGFAHLENVARFQRALALRNRAVVVARLGQDAIPLVNDSIEETLRELAAEPVVGVGPLEFLADSYQVLGELHYRAGDGSAAEEACLQTIATLDRLAAAVRIVSGRSGYTPPSHGHRLARRLAERNRGRAAAGAEKSTDDWQWRPLRPLHGEALHTDLLARGRLPADFEPHTGLLLSWLDRSWATGVLTQIAAATWERLQLVILVPSETMKAEAVQTLADVGVDPDAVHFVVVAADTIWARDWGPLVLDVGNEAVKWVDAVATAAEDFPRFRDDHIPGAVSEMMEVSRVGTSVFLHGGGLLTNGAGLCLVARSQLAWNDELGIPESHVAETLRRLVGAEQLVFLDTLVDEPTEHVDWFLAFTAVNQVVVGEYRGGDPTNAAVLNGCAKQLANLPTPAGPLQVHRIPMPPRGSDYFGGTYTNVVFANGVLLVPTWPDAAAENEEALATYRQLLPDWEVVGIDCSSLVRREGALHCATRNLYRIPAEF